MSSPDKTEECHVTCVPATQRHCEDGLLRESVCFSPKAERFEKVFAVKNHEKLWKIMKNQDESWRKQLYPSIQRPSDAARILIEKPWDELLPIGIEKASGTATPKDMALKVGVSFYSFF